VRSPHALALALLTLSSVACDAHPEHPRAQPDAALRVELDERPVLIGDVIERAESESYVYLRLSIVSDSAMQQLRPHTSERWVAVEGVAPELDERIHVRSLARRSNVWEPTLARHFEVLEYVAVLER
jgi:hypothetical protein